MHGTGARLLPRREPAAWQHVRVRVVLLMRWLVLLAVVAVAAVTVHPDVLGVFGGIDERLVGLSMRSYLAQAIAMRPLVFLGMAALAALVLLAGLISRVRARRRAHDGWPADAPRRSRGRATLVLGVCLALVAGAHAAVLGTRGLDAGATIPRGAGPGSPEAFTVLTYNTFGAAVRHDEIADLMTSRDVDVAVLPETNAGTAERVQQDLAAAGRRYHLFTDATTGLDHSAIAVLVAEELGRFRQSAGPETMLASIRLEPVDGSTSGAPTIIAVHPIAPSVGRMQRWRDDVYAVTDVCRALPGGDRIGERLVMAGDFNATRDHRAMRDLGGCVDAASESGTGAVATWPTSFPALAGAAIDHILVEDAAWRVVASEVVDVGGSDHRGVIARLEAR